MQTLCTAAVINHTPSDDPRWDAVVQRDATFDGRFFYSVASTGVYCRPSCASRLAKRDTVAFHDSAAEAQRAGFRPCKRCRPNEPSQALRHAELIKQACALIDSRDPPPSLAELSQAVGISRFHFHRLFRDIVGITPKDYAARRRIERLKDGLNAGHSVTSAIYGAGYGSNSRFYEQAADSLGMKATAYRDGGRGAEIRFAIGECSLGSVLVAATDIGLCAILLGDDPQALLDDVQARFPKAHLLGGDAAFEQTIGRVIAQIESPKSSFDLPLDIRGTAFQQQVWRALREIPTGQTQSYAEVARQIGAPRSTRAVAGACAANPLAVAIPCHRVVRSDGGLSGYRWGLERKRELLARESAP